MKFVEHLSISTFGHIQDFSVVSSHDTTHVKIIMQLPLFRKNSFKSVYAVHNHLIGYTTHFTQQISPREATSSAASQEIPPILGNNKIPYFSHQIPPPVPALSLLNQVDALTYCLCKVPSNIILPSTLGSSSCFFPLESSPSSS